MKIWTDDEYLEVDPNDVGELEAAMLFKAEHIKAKADPELFVAVADMLSRMRDYATERADVVRCQECKHWNSDTWFCNLNSYFSMYGLDLNIFSYDDFCSYGEKKEGAD